MKTIANLWLDYIPNSYVECHPYFVKNKIYHSINIANTLWDNNEIPDSYTFYRKDGYLPYLLKPPLWFQVKNKLFRKWDHTQFHKFILQKLAAENAKLLFIHFGTTAAQIIPVLEKITIPSIAIFYGSDASSALQNPHFVEQYKKMFPLLTKIIVLCEPVKERLHKLGCDKEKIFVWNLPAGIEKYPYQMRKKSEIVKLVICARFIEKKGHYFLLEAFKKIIDSGIKAELTIIGYGNWKPKILEKIEALSLERHTRVVDTEAKGDFAKLYYQELKSKDIFILPSTTAQNDDDEGGPALTLVCAQAAGLPVICTPFPGADITVIDGETGIYCKENDIDSLFEKITNLIESGDEKWNQIGKNASNLVHKEFSELGQMNKLIALFNKEML